MLSLGARTTNIGLLYPNVRNNIGGDIPIDVRPHNQNIGGDVSPGIPGGVDASVLQSQSPCRTVISLCQTHNSTALRLCMVHCQSLAIK